MTIRSGKQFIVELVEDEGTGSCWIVRAYKRTFLFKKRISSDWFLDEEQARRFADELARELASRDSLSRLKDRMPGWTLHRPR